MTVGSSSCRVLVVDPSPDIQSSIRRHVQGRGFSISAVPDLPAAYASLDQEVPDIVITDLFLPEESGFVLAKELRTRHELCPVIVMAQKASHSVVVKALREGAVDYLHKPIAEEELAQALYRARRLLPGHLADMSGVRRSEHRLIMDSDPAQVPGVIAWLMKTTAGALSEVRRLHLRGALQELLINAVEHGNLEIPHREKQQAMACNTYEVLLAQRLADVRVNARQVVIDVRYEREAKRIVYRIADGGAGFDWRDMMSRSPAHCDHHAGNGRGIFLARSLFPSLTYNDRGNEVTFSLPLNRREVNTCADI